MIGGFILMAAISSCSAESRYKRLIKKHPELVKTDTVIVKDTSVGLNKNELIFAQINLFPNPASQVLNIQAKFIQTVPVTVTIIDLLGKTHFTKTYTDKTFADAIQTDAISNGIYFVNFNNANGSRTFKLILNK
jgi:hypothetical protein